MTRTFYWSRNLRVPFDGHLDMVCQEDFGSQGRCAVFNSVYWGGRDGVTMQLKLT